MMNSMAARATSASGIQVPPCTGEPAGGELGPNAAGGVTPITSPGILVPPTNGTQDGMVMPPPRSVPVGFIIWPGGLVALGAPEPRDSGLSAPRLNSPSHFDRVPLPAKNSTNAIRIVAVTNVQ